MQRASPSIALSVGFGVVMVLASVALAINGPSTFAGESRLAPSSTTADPSMPVAAPTTGVDAPVGPASAVTSKLAAIHAELARDGAPELDVHLPNLAAEGHRTGQPVSPTYSEAPSPMGVADIGLRDVGGALTGYVLNTSSTEGTVNLTDAQSVYVDGDGPDMFGVQLNAVLTNVTLFGNSSYQFWTQNFVSYTPSSGELAFGDNLWNFTNASGNFSSNALYSHGPNGTVYAPVLYLAVGPTYTIHYPFSLTFYLNSTLISGRSAVFFNYTLANSTMSRSGSFDYVVFNSTGGTTLTPAPVPPMYQVNGDAYNALGLLNDIELSLLGNDNGDTTTFYQLNATASIAYWNATTGSYRPVPSAVNAGADTGETSDGVASYYSGASAVAQLAPGPSFLSGLWNSTTPPGERTVVATLAPAPALILVNPGPAVNESSAQWVPSSPTGTTTFKIPNTGEFTLDFELSDYAPLVRVEPGSGANATSDVTVTLPSDPALGIYTPLIVWGNAELADLAQSGTGTAADPYVLNDTGVASLDPEFGQWNDFQFPVFPGLLLVSTTAYADITPPSFALQYPEWMLNGTHGIYADGLPATNDLQLEFWNVSNVALVNGYLSGWLSANTFSFYPLGAVIFWNSSGNLIAGNEFADQGIGLAFYGGSDNTVWGNAFLQTGVAASDPSNVLENPSNQTGIWESESGDLVYNNYFSVPVPAYTPSFDPLSCQIECEPQEYYDRWNVSRESATATADVLGYALTGSIIDTSYQGGNYWSNYGTPADPYGELPYDDSQWIRAGGDYVPLVPFSLYTVTFTESGLASRTPWGVITSLIVTNTTGAVLNFPAPNGTYPFSVVVPTGYAVVTPANFTVDGQNLSVSLRFSEISAPTSNAIGSEGWEVIVALAVVVAILAAALAAMWVRSRRPPSEGGARPPGEPTESPSTTESVTPSPAGAVSPPMSESEPPPSAPPTP